MILSELIAAVRIRLGEPTAGFWTDPNLTDCLNNAARQFSIDSGVLLAAPVKTSSQAGVHAYPLPTGCLGMHMIQAVWYNGTRLMPSVPLSIMSVDGDPISGTPPPKKYYVLTHDSKLYLVLYPAPDTAVTNGIVVWYSMIATKMVYSASADDTCDIPDDYCDAVIDLATSYAFALKHDEESIKRYEKYYGDRLSSAQAFVNSLIIAGMRDQDATAKDARPIF